MHSRSAALALGTLALLAAPAIPGNTLPSEAWIADFDVAAAAAKEQKKDLLVDFTGSDWCGWCIKLHEEVFGFEEFVSAAQKDFVLVALDYPHSEEAKAKVPNPDRNKELQKKYEIRGFPTVLLMSADGDVYASTGYQPGGVEAYLTHLTEIRTSGRKALETTNEILASFDKAEGKEKLALWEKAVGVLETLDSSSPFAARLAVPVRYAFEVDPKNESGMKMRAIKALLEAGQIDDATKAAGRELDPKNEHGLLEQIVQAQFQSVTDDETARAALDALDALAPLGFADKKIGFELNFMAAQWCSGPLEDKDRSKQYALAAKEIGTDDENMAKYLDELLNG